MSLSPDKCLKLLCKYLLLSSYLIKVGSPLEIMLHSQNGKVWRKEKVPRKLLLILDKTFCLCTFPFFITWLRVWRCQAFMKSVFKSPYDKIRNFFSIMITLCWFHWFLLCCPVWTNQNLKFIIYEGSCHSKNFCVEFYMVASYVVNKGLYWHILWPFDNLDLKWEVPKSWSVMFLSINPFCLARSEEKCLVRSGLVQLMDRLCSLSSQTESSSSEKQTKKQKVATMAWAAFQVLANRCVEWEKEEGEEQDPFL